jgi:periplasmic copper chaperone A
MPAVKSSSRILAAVAALLLCSAVQAAPTVHAQWVRPTPDRTATEAFMVLTSVEGAVLKEVKSPLATTVVMRAAGSGTRNLPQIALPAGVPVALAPDAAYLVLRGLAHPLVVGDRVPLSLTFEGTNGVRQEISITAEVRLHSPLDDVRRAQAR